MSRVKKPVVRLRWLLAAAVALFAPTASAQLCASTRPTDAKGAAGLSYGSAAVDFFDSASGRARIHYALSGTSAPPPASTLEPGVPDAVVVAAQAADDAFDKYDELGYRKPLSDGDSPCGSNGDSDAVDIYLIHFAGADGQAVLDHCEAGLPKRCAGFILVENDFKGGGYADETEGLRTVVPHELFHLVQNSYDADVEHWWAEGSAQWAAKQVYPELHDLERFLPAYFASPWRPLNVPPNGVLTDFLYATAIWPVFLSERFDAGVVREVFEGFGQGTDGVLPATDAVLAARGSSLAAEFLAFATYNAATGERAPDAGGYVAAADYPLVKLKPLALAPGVLASDVGSGMGAYYYSLTADVPTQLTLDADPQRMAGVLVPLVDGKLDLGSEQPLPATLEGDGVIVVAGQSLARTDAPFALKAGEPGPAPGSGAAGCSVAQRPQDGAKTGAGGLVAVMLWGMRSARRRARKGE
jgi:hypothetical protein